MRILITYDVETISPDGQKRLRKVAKACKDFGQRVQNSVFECMLTELQYLSLKESLKRIIDIKHDSIRIYHLSKNPVHSTEIIGKETSYNPEETLII